MRFLAATAVVLLSLCSMTAGLHAADLPWTRPPAPEIPEDRPLRVGFLLVDGIYNTELVAPYDLFNHAVYQVQPGMETFTVSADGMPVTTAEGLIVQAHYSFETAQPIDILVVASAENSRGSDRENKVMIDWVRKVGGEAKVVMSLCWGAFVLAEAGLLDDLAATTFPSDHDLFEQTFDKIDVQRQVSFVHHGKAVTSQGGVKSYEAGMYVLDWLYGPDVAKGVGGGLLIEWPPAEGSVEGMVVAGPSRQDEKE